jgi:hypothetical protein
MILSNSHSVYFEGLEMRITEDDIIDFEIAREAAFSDRVVSELATRSRLSTGDIHRLVQEAAVGVQSSVRLVSVDTSQTNGSDLLIFRGFTVTGESAPKQPSVVLMALLCSPANGPKTVRHRGAIRSALTRGLLADVLLSRVDRSGLAEQIQTEFDRHL